MRSNPRRSVVYSVNAASCSSHCYLAFVVFRLGAKMDRSEKDAMLKAISGRISKCTIPICKSMGNNLEVGTAVLVEIGNRLFAVTCNHTIPANQGEIWMISSKPVARSHYIHNELVIDSWKPAESWPDGGVVELDLENTRKLLEPHFEPLDLAEISLSFNPDRLAVVSGFPGQLVDSKDISEDSSGRKMSFGFQGILIPGEPISQDKWPQPKSPSPDTHSDVDIFLPYQEGEVVEVQYQETRFDQAQSHPGGLSGGGIWQARPYEGGVWSPELRLVGIQCRSLPSKYLRGIRIRFVIELLASIDEQIASEVQSLLE